MTISKQTVVIVGANMSIIQFKTEYILKVMYAETDPKINPTILIQHGLPLLLEFAFFDNVPNILRQCS